MAWCRQEAITWANVDPDLCGPMASLGHTELHPEAKAKSMSLVQDCSNSIANSLELLQS